MRQKPKAITPDLSRRWARTAHLLFIDALSASAPLAMQQIAFHGGTNLHLSWGSPRYSEDLDFLLDRTLGERMRAIIPRVERRMQVLAQGLDPNLKVAISDRTRDPQGLLNFRIVLSSREVVGQVMAKAEFWQVNSDYLSMYETRFANPVAKGDLISRISQPIPAATLKSAFADKIVALGYRPHLKWRDLFDLWWICGQEAIRPTDMIPRIQAQASAYQGPEGVSLEEGLRAFLARDIHEIVAQADPDLKRWVPKPLWDAINPEGITQMVMHARDISREIADCLAQEAMPAADTLSGMRDTGPEAGDAHLCI